MTSFIQSGFKLFVKIVDNAVVAAQEEDDTGTASINEISLRSLE